MSDISITPIDVLRVKRRKRIEREEQEQQAQILEAVLELETTLARRQAIIAMMTRWANDALTQTFQEQYERYREAMS